MIKKLILVIIVIIISMLMYFIGIMMAHGSVMAIIMFWILTLIVLMLPVIYRVINKGKTADFKKIVSKIELFEEFNEIYNQLYNDHISKLEALRKKAKLEEIAKTIMLIATVLGFFIGKTTDNYLILMCSILLFFITILFTIFSRSTKTYKENYKTEIVSNFVKLVNNNLKYMPKDDREHILSKEFRESKIETNYFNKYKAEDYIEGNLSNNIMLKMADIDVKNVVRTSKGRSVEYIFNGIFAVTTGEKSIDGYIKIAKNQILKFEENTSMDSEEFEKEFDVFSDNEILTMQILTPDIMESLLEFKNKYDIDFEIVINKNKVYLRFFVRNMFEPKIFGNSMDKELLLIYYVILDFIIKVTEKINKVILDTAI